MGRKFWKTDFRKLFYNKFYFFMSNLNVECFQLSFDIVIEALANLCAFISGLRSPLGNRLGKF